MDKEKYVKGCLNGKTVAIIHVSPSEQSMIIGYIGFMTDIVICLDSEINGFYKIKTNFGISGYCDRMKITFNEKG